MPEEIAVSFAENCENGSITTLAELKAQIGLKLYEIKAAEEPVVEKPSAFEAPVNTPEMNSFVNDSAKAKKKDKWEALREMNKK